jgi:hypothetical protein
MPEPYTTVSRLYQSLADPAILYWKPCPMLSVTDSCQETVIAEMLE